ncbi:sigma-70 family RNA polymerase sigma factor [Paenibacillus xylanexedens]|uniref:sigma-70 family RNA polymerase sigma factor n=1 Tax=Paenibacillus xylanexedens TaxID=528191 RepID=UPI001643E075|nr:sigma-70 family RNA polymerase sigma factor [Paenibacillus xylanexedens]
MSTLEKAAYDYTVDRVHLKFEEYRNQNPELFCNQVIVNFFKQENNQKLLLGSMKGENDKEEALNESFRRYFFQIRFVAYVTSSLQFMSIDQMRRNQRYAARNVLIYDKPSSDDSSVCIGEIKSTYQSSPDTAQPDEYSMFLKGNFTDEHVESAYQKLTDKQKHVTTLYYGFGYRDHEIATKLQVSQQAVAKTRNTALKKMKTTMLGEGS